MRNKTISIISALFLSTFSVVLTAQEDSTKIDELFEMSLSDLMNQEVVTSSRFSQPTGEAASSVVVISSDEIAHFNYSTLGEALNGRAGIFLSNDKNYLSTGSRGFSRPTDYNNRIVIMLDGHILNEVVYGSAFMGNDFGINLKNVEKIEVIRGPGASIYGSGAMLNIINIITKKGTSEGSLQVTPGIGSFGKKEISASYNKDFGNTALSVSAITGKSDGEDYYFEELDTPENNNGESINNDWEKFGAFQATLTHKSFNLSGYYSTRSKGIPTGAFDTDLTGDVRSKDDRYFIQGSYKKEINENNSLLLRLYYDDYCYDGSYPSGGIELYDASKGRWTGSEIQYYLEAGKRNVITAGAEYRHIFRADYKEWDDSEVYFNNNFPYSFISLYAQDQLSILENLKLTAGLRYDMYSRFGNSFSPRLSLVYNYSESSYAKLLYSEAFRIPDIYESFYESENDHKSNPDIKPEKIKSIELVLGHKISDKLYGTLSAYLFNLIDLIDQQLDGADGLTYFTNIGVAQGKGIEAELRYQNNNLSAFLNLTVQRATDENSKEILSNSPALLIKTGWIIPVIKGFQLSPEFFYESGRKTLKENMTDGVYLFNLSLHTPEILGHLDLVIKGRNLLNTKYFYPGGYEHAQDALIQDSRSFIIQLNAKF